MSRSRRVSREQKAHQGALQVLPCPRAGALCWYPQTRLLLPAEPQQRSPFLLHHHTRHAPSSSCPFPHAVPCPLHVTSCHSFASTCSSPSPYREVPAQPPLPLFSQPLFLQGPFGLFFPSRTEYFPCQPSPKERRIPMSPRCPQVGLSMLRACLWLGNVQSSIPPCSQVDVGLGRDPWGRGESLALVGLPAQQGNQDTGPGQGELGRLGWRTQGWAFV